MTDPKTIIFDCQVLQTPAWHRGMGKYTLDLLRYTDKAIDAAHQITYVIMLNSRLPSEASMIAELKEATPNMAIYYADLLTTDDNKSHVFLKEQNQKRINDFMSENDFHKNCEFLITSLFLQEACPVFPGNCRKVLLFYDLIPMMYYRRYLGMGPSEQYFIHMKTLFESDLLLTISKTVANDLTLYLGISPNKVVNIDGAAITRVNSKKSPCLQVDEDRPFILMPTGGELRKNNLNAVKGFEIFNEAHDNKYQLVLTSTFSDPMIADLKAECEALTFTGNISESELSWLYDRAESVLFPSEYEGLGLPVLEAAEANQPIACSNIAVFREMSTTAFYYFDPLSPDQIAVALMASLFGDDIPTKLKQYPSLLNRYTWENSVKTMMAAFNTTTMRPSKSRLRVAVVCPNVSADSEEGYLISLLHASLAEKMDITYYFDFGITPKPARPNYLGFVVPTHPISELTAAVSDEYDLIMYHITNDQYSIGTLTKALSTPGLVIMHAPSLDNLFELARSRGAMNASRYEAEKRLNGMYKTDTFGLSLLDASKGLVFFDKVLANHWKKSIAALHTKSLTLQFPKSPLPYVVKRTFRGDFTIGVYLRNGTEDNIDLLHMLETRIEEGYCTIIVFSRNKLDRIVKRKLRSLKNVVTVKDDVTDFEVEDLLMKQDALVDYQAALRTTGQTDMLYDALRQGVEVLANNFETSGQLMTDQESIVEALIERILNNVQNPVVYKNSSLDKIAENLISIAETQRMDG